MGAVVAGGAALGWTTVVDELLVVEVGAVVHGCHANNHDERRDHHDRDDAEDGRAVVRVADLGCIAHEICISFVERCCDHVYPLHFGL